MNLLCMLNTSEIVDKMQDSKADLAESSVIEYLVIRKD